MRVLSWNLYHGRDFPPDPALFTWRSRLLRDDRAERDARAGEPPAARRVRAAGSTASTGTWPCSRRRRRAGSASSAGARARAACACSPRATRAAAPAPRWRTCNPDLIASCEGGSNQLLVRAPGRVLEHRRLTLAMPARAAAHASGRGCGCASGDTLCVANLHASAGLPEQARGELLARPPRAVEWSGATRSCSAATSTCARRATPSPFEELRERFGLGEPTGAATRSTTCWRAASRSWSRRGGFPPSGASCPRRTACASGCPTTRRSARASR